jgi:thiol-disulfide isomerase/thioredoxin
MVHITDSTPTVFAIHFVNPFLQQSPRVQLNEKGALLVRGEMLFAQNMTVRYNNVFINLYVVPGDSVHLAIDAARLQENDFSWLTITGDHASLSTQLNKAHHYMASLPYKKYDMRLPAPAMLAAVREDYNSKLASFTTYASAHQLDTLVVNFIRRDLLYGISNWITDYVYDSLLAAEKQDRIQLFNDTLFDMHNAANFQTMMFAYHLGWYARWITGKDSLVQQARAQEKYQAAARAGAAILLQQPPTISRDYMLYSFLSGLILQTPNLLKEMPEIRSYFTAPLYYDYLSRSMQKAHSTSFAVLPVTGLYCLNAAGKENAVPRTDVLQYLAKKYPGKVIYLDLYSTWCGPCREEMKYTPALHQAYKNKAVVFVNICAQDDIVSWKKLIKEKKLTGKHYFLDVEASKLFMGNYRMDAFPTYCLINKKGSMITTHAPRPSDGAKLHRKLDELLLE